MEDVGRRPLRFGLEEDELARWASDWRAALSRRLSAPAPDEEPRSEEDGTGEQRRDRRLRHDRKSCLVVRAAVVQRNVGLRAALSVGSSAKKDLEGVISVGQPAEHIQRD